jgi:hypothetical protein
MYPECAALVPAADVLSAPLRIQLAAAAARLGLQAKGT